MHVEPVRERPAAPARIRRSSRVAFIDLARALAVLMMIQGHTIDALLAPGHRDGSGYATWVFVRGLTSCLFLLLSGFAFSVATRRHWARHLDSLAPGLRRLRRFTFFMLLGYLLRFPVGRLTDLRFVTEPGWRQFLVVDVLQCIGFMLIVLQVLVLLARTPARFGVVTGAACVAVVTLTPAMWRVDWEAWLPVGVAAYLSPGTGSLFPLFPWMAYGLLGATLGEVYARWGVARLPWFVTRVLLMGGVAMVAAGLLFDRVPLAPFGPTEFWSTSPNLFFLRAGLVLAILGVVAHASRLARHPPRFVGALAQESLVVYFVHLCIVYGSPFNPGLRHAYGESLSRGASLFWVSMLFLSMIALAWGWNWCKHARPRAARAVKWGLTAILAAWLL